MSNTGAENEELVRGLVEPIDAGQFGRLDEYLSADLVGHSPATPEDIHGPEGDREFLTAFDVGGPDARRVNRRGTRSTFRASSARS